MRRAASVFAGPGSPTYALRVWAGSPLPELLAEKLSRGGAVTFASAAALTLGAVTVPVYEIYKVGEEPRWEPGLDLLGPIGLPVAVIPHFDNAEGGNHDTRFCYLGERRLTLLESQLPDGAYVLGVDEHTACVIDVDAGSVSVAGHGTMTVRRDGRATVFPAGTVVGIEDLAQDGSPGAAQAPAAFDESPPATAAGVLDEAERLRRAFDAAVDGLDVDAAVASVLALDQAIVDWSRDTLQSDETDRARSVLRGMVVRLGELARVGARDPREAVAPLVAAVIAARDRAREARDFATADALRDGLVAAGIDVHDTPDGTSWALAGAADQAATVSGPPAARRAPIV